MKDDSKASYGPSPDLTFGVAVVPYDGSSSDNSTLSTDISFGLDYDSAFDFYEPSSALGKKKTGFLYQPVAGRCSLGYASETNVTRIADLPENSNLIALAPLGSVQCGASFINQAVEDGAEALIFYDYAGGWSSLTFNYQDDSAELSLISDTNMRSYSSLSVYYVTGKIGSELVEQLESYSGNLTDVPNGDKLKSDYDSRDYVRVFVEIQSHGSHHLAALFIYIIVAVVAVLVLLAAASVIVHRVQAQRRKNLLRRLKNGEIDLAAVGIIRLTVPRGILDTFPTRLYVPTSGDSESDLQPEETNVTTKSAEMIVTAAEVAGFHQQSCPICLEDFRVNESLVKQLPCEHIYHVSCIDDFLEHHSSVCPLCKQSVLPKGYIPPTLQITNATVKRERLLRQDRERGLISDDTVEFLSNDRRHELQAKVFRERWGGGGRQALPRKWTRVAPDDNDDDTLELNELRLQSTSAGESISGTTAYTDDEDTSESEYSQKEPERARRQLTILQRTHLPAREEPGAIVAPDGSVIVVRSSVKEEAGQKSTIKQILHLLFPYIF
ncbi:hypothetical protein BZA70DRAFT_279338 [Myxozyma melibiosi]|uniref:RING-type domain-containing protein n=1 Tax=Myxozyma melibiosi TaxID=54550 RepID=A0ABR1F5W6_9ASCO